MPSPENVQSPHFTPLRLDAAFNVSRDALPERLRCPPRFRDRYAQQVVRGIPVLFGDAGRPNVILLDRDEVVVDVGGATASYVLLVHVVEEASDMNTYRGADQEDGDGYRLGGLVSDYELRYEDGSTAATSILRRFAIQQARCGWGSAPFACVPAAEDKVIEPAQEALARGAPVVGFSPTRTQAASSYMLSPNDGLLWMYALPNPRPDAPIATMTLRPREERSAVYAVTLTTLDDHPLRARVRRKARVALPDGVRLNPIGEVDPERIGIDLGAVISARAVLDYDSERWHDDEAVVEPRRSDREVVVEYAAHPRARLYIGDDIHELGAHDDPRIQVLASGRPVRFKFVDKTTREVVAVRFHAHGESGEYLPPRGHHRKVNRGWPEDNHAEFANVENQYAYVDGRCVVDAPVGTIYVEITRGYEIAPIRTSVEITALTDEVTFELERVLDWRAQGWVTADTHVHFLSPQTALLEGAAEGVNVVNLLASQWGEMYSNVGDYDGKTTFGADDLGGRGEFLVRVGSENRMQVLGHISLLGYRGELIQPLCTGGPDESAFGDPLEVTMAEWAQRCVDQDGLVVMPHAPNPQLERAADIVLGLVDAMEMMCMNPLAPRFSDSSTGQVDASSPINPYGVADWYRYLNLGYHIPVVGGSDKMVATSLLGGIRTYANLGERELTYENWMQAIREGNTFVTVGPLIALAVEGLAPGSRLQLPATGGTVHVEWRVESLRVPIDTVEVIVGGEIEEISTVGGKLMVDGSVDVPIRASTWVALRIRGSYHGNPQHIAAHSSAVQVTRRGLAAVLGDRFDGGPGPDPGRDRLRGHDRAARRGAAIS